MKIPQIHEIFDRELSGKELRKLGSYLEEVRKVQRKAERERILKLIKTIRPEIPIGMLITDKVQLERGIELLRCELRDKIKGE